MFKIKEGGITQIKNISHIDSIKINGEIFFKTLLSDFTAVKTVKPNF
jgi:hypothetical protein